MIILSYVVFVLRLYPVIMPLLAFALPMMTFCYCGETILDAWYITVARWILQVNGTWCVNSAAHIWGTRPYDKCVSDILIDSLRN